jgi:hypothetical protein
MFILPLLLHKFRDIQGAEEGGLAGVPSWGQERQAGSLSYIASEQDFSSSNASKRLQFAEHGRD